MSKPRRPSILVLATLGLGLTAGACQDDPPTPKLFEEQGAWSVIIYDLEGTGEQREVDVSTRRDAFMLFFDAADKVVTSAACIETEFDDVSNSLCLLDPTNTHWDCRCFAYAFEREEMLWQEFNAGDMVPSVSLSGSNDPAGGTTAGDGGATGDGQTHITVAEVMDVNSTFNFRPLPDGVFGSDGMTSRFVLQKRADSVFDRAYEDPEGRPGCVECAN